MNKKEIQFVDGGSNVGLQYKEITRSTISLNGSWSESNFFTTKISFLNFSDYVNIFITIQLQIEYVRDSTGSGSNVCYGWQESDKNSSSGQFWMTSNGVRDISGVIMYNVLQITYNTNIAIYDIIDPQNAHQQCKYVGFTNNVSTNNGIPLVFKPLIYNSTAQVTNGKFIVTAHGIPISSL